MSNSLNDKHLPRKIDKKYTPETLALIKRTEKCMKLLAKTMELENDYTPMVLFNRLKEKREEMLMGNDATVKEIQDVLNEFE